MTAKERLINRLPMKYRPMVRDLSAEYGLIDDCKYILQFNEGYDWDGYDTVPVRSISEAIHFVKEGRRTEC